MSGRLAGKRRVRVPEVEEDPNLPLPPDIFALCLSYLDVGEAAAVRATCAGFEQAANKGLAALRTVELTDRYIDDRGLLALARVCPHLNSLSLEARALSDDGIARLRTALPRLRELRLAHGYFLTCESLHAIAESPGRLRTLSLASPFWSRGAESRHCLRQLIDAHAPYLEALTLCNVLPAHDDTEIGLDLLATLARSAASAPRGSPLRELSLNPVKAREFAAFLSEDGLGAQVGDGVTAAAAAVAAVAAAAAAAVAAAAAAVAAAAAAAAAAAQLLLTVEDPQGSNLGNGGPAGAAAAEPLPAAAPPAIPGIILSSSVNRKPFTQLRRLHLELDCITDGLCHALPLGCPSLVDLSLRDSATIASCGPSDGGLQALAGCRQIARVSVARAGGSFKKCSDVGLVFLALAWPKLEAFVMRGMEKASDATVSVLLDSCPLLRQLHLQCSTCLTGHAFYRLGATKANSSVSTAAKAATGSKLARNVTNSAASTSGNGRRRDSSSSSGSSGSSGGSSSSSSSSGGCVELDTCASSSAAAALSTKLVPLGSLLTSINLSRCSHVASSALQHLLETATALEELNVAGCCLSEKILALAFCLPQLRQLSLGRCSLPSEAFVHAAKDFASARRKSILQRLSVTRCEIDAAAVSALCASGVIGSAMRSIDLHFNERINDFAVASIVAAAPLLTDLRVRRCARISDAALRWLLASPARKTLTYLDMSGCGLSPAGVAEFFAAPHLPRLGTLALGGGGRGGQRAAAVVSQERPQCYVTWFDQEV